MGRPGAVATPDRIEKTNHGRLESARPPHGVWRDAEVPHQRCAEGARGPKAVFLRHPLDRIGTLLEVMHGKEQPAPGDAAPGRGETGAPEPVFQGAPPDPARLRDLLHAERLLGKLEAEAEGQDQGRGHFGTQRSENPLGDFGTRGR